MKNEMIKGGDREEQVFDESYLQKKKETGLLSLPLSLELKMMERE